MLKHLRLQNIILVEQADIPFGEGLNIISGETGAGKSAIMKGLSLAVGDRSDTGMIRKGCDKGIVEAIFDVDAHPAIHALFIEAGVDHEPSQELIIRRELNASGKSRIFINNQLAQLSFLRKLGILLTRIVGQHANQQLFSVDYHRDVLDLHGDLSLLLQKFKKSFELENSIRKGLESLIQQESQRLRDIDICQRELEELDEACLKEGEDEDLFAQYSLLVNSKELAEKAYEVNQNISGERQSILANLNRTKLILDSLAQLDPNIKETSQSFQNAVLEIQEVAHTIRRYQSSVQNDPERLNTINDRLTLINKLKRKYGETVDQINAYMAETRERLDKLQNAESQIEDLQKQLKETELTTNRLAQELTKARSAGAHELEKALTSQLRSLNMSKAQFIVQVNPQKRTSEGDDRIEFLLQPNTGEHQIALKEEASGGEVSRVLLAIQTLLAGKDAIPTLIFDEVDANIGGETAAVVGNKLREIGQKHQVICVTHFPQVASRAHQHLQISKKEKEGRTFTQVERLDPNSQKKELDRMVGIGTKE
ncbi:MAG: DNA repair protein RecN [Parachlamydiaceae bacterium]|nr:DNA repair protein RecN [Parachlamydiaceae bacterium]